MRKEERKRKTEKKMKGKKKEKENTNKKTKNGLAHENAQRARGSARGSAV